MSATRRLTDHTCTTFVTVSHVVAALCARDHTRGGQWSAADKRRTFRTYGWRSRLAPLTCRAGQALEALADKADARGERIYRCATCKRWVSVTPTSFNPAMTHGELTRLTKAEARQLAERPIVFTVSPACDATDAPYLAKLPGYGYDVRHPYTEETRGRNQTAWRYRFKGTVSVCKFARNAR